MIKVENVIVKHRNPYIGLSGKTKFVAEVWIFLSDDIGWLMEGSYFVLNQEEAIGKANKRVSVIKSKM